MSEKNALVCAYLLDGKGGEAGTEKVCSDSLFGYAVSGSENRPAWIYRKGLVLNSTIANEGEYP